jgi:hypothetical protein
LPIFFANRLQDKQEELADTSARSRPVVDHLLAGLTSALVGG